MQYTKINLLLTFGFAKINKKVNFLSTHAFNTLKLKTTFNFFFNKLFVLLYIYIEFSEKLK